MDLTRIAIENADATPDGAFLALPVFGGLVPGPGADEVVAQHASHLEAIEFTAKNGQTVLLPDGVLLVGLGDDLDLEGLRQAAGAVASAAPAGRVVATTLHQVDLDGSVGAVTEGFLLGSYRYDQYRSKKTEPAPALVLLEPVAESWNADVARARVVAEAVCFARDLVNLPAREKGPRQLADLILAEAQRHGVTVEVFDETWLAQEGMEGILGVGAGSHRPPCLVRIETGPVDGKRLALVGKGICFDSGGLSLKPADMMENMKSDMAGAAAVAAVAIAAGRLQIPVSVVALAPLAENLPGGSATRPGDVLTIRNGKTIEVLNTDAEGRLVLADALSLAAEQTPDLIVDVATLTGAARVALGDKIAGLFGNSDQAIDSVSAAARRAGERVWPMPLPADYRPLIDSEVADMKNTGGRYGGAISAALLLSEFVGEVPWVHLDIAGPGRSDKAENYVKKGGTGFGVRTLIELAEALAG